MDAIQIVNVVTRTTEKEGPAIAERRFFSAMALAALAAVFVGFATSYYLWPITRALDDTAGQGPPFPLIVHVHAMAFTTWILLFVAQVRLIAGGRRDVHRRLGVAGAWLVPILVVTGLMTAVRGARDGWNPGGPYTDALGFMIVPVGDIVVFTALLIPGLVFRSRPGVHKRLVLLATLGGLLPPAITRMPIIAGRPLPMFAMFGALVLAPAAWDFWRASRYRWLSLGLGMAVLASVVLRPVIGSTAPWRTFAAWAVG